MKKFILSIMLLLTLICFAGCNISASLFEKTEFYTAKSRVEKENDSSYSLSYKLLDGEYKHVIKPNSSEIKVNCVTESGSVEMIVKDADENIIFQQSDIETSDFTIECEMLKEYTVTFNADDHKGSFELNW